MKAVIDEAKFDARNYSIQKLPQRVQTQNSEYLLVWVRITEAGILSLFESDDFGNLYSKNLPI